MTLTIPSLVYLAVVCLVFFNIREALKTRFLAAASVLYVFFLNRYAGAVVLSVSVLAWAWGCLIGRLIRQNFKKAAAAVTGISVAAMVISLALFKYVHVVSPAIGSVHLSELIMPIGYSFYIFQVISYLVDICSGRAAPFRSWFDVLLFLCWFPKFVSGPIERKEEFGQQIKKAEKALFLDMGRWNTVIKYVLVGCFYKLVIADRVGKYVDHIFEHYDGFSSTWLIIGVFLYSVQIYCDFAGYSYAAIGISAAFDIRLTQNFMTPYFSPNITEFWRRWHRSLSSWLRDYVYIPLGGNRCGNVKKMINTLTVFVLCGMWHGSKFGFLVWGLLHGIYTALDGVLKSRDLQWIRKGIPGRLLTFLAVSFSWIFFRASSARGAVKYIRSIMTAGPGLRSFNAEMLSLNLNNTEISVIAALLIILFIIEITAYRNDCPVPEILGKKHYLVRYSAVLILVTAVIVLGMYGPTYDSSHMIYMQF